MHSKTLARAGLFAFALLTGSAATAQDSTAGPQSAPRRSNAIWRVSIGANYSTGDYGDPSDTEVLSIPLALRYSEGNFRARVSVPYIFLSGPGSLIDRPEGGGSEVGGGAPPSRSNQGFGDVSISAGYLLPLGRGFSLDATGRLKLPTASRAERLGTGEVDVTAGLDLVREFRGGSVYAGARRKFVGDPDDRNLRDIWRLGTGASFRAARGFTVGADYVWQQSSHVGGGDISEVTAWTSIRLNARFRLTVYAGTGFTTNSSDFASGATLSCRL